MVLIIVYILYIYFRRAVILCSQVLPQRVCDGHETRTYYRALHGECDKGVGGRRFVATEKSAAQIPTLTKIDAMFLCVYGRRM